MYIPRILNAIFSINWKIFQVFLLLVHSSTARKHHRSTLAEIINTDSTPAGVNTANSNQPGWSSPNLPIDSNLGVGNHTVAPVVFPKSPNDPRIKSSFNSAGSNVPLVVQNQVISRPIPNVGNPPISAPNSVSGGPNANLATSQLATNNRFPTSQVESRLNAQVQVVDADAKPNPVQPQPNPSGILEPISLIPEQPKVQPIQVPNLIGIQNTSQSLNNGKTSPENFQPRPKDILVPELLAQSRINTSEKPSTILQPQNSAILSGQQVANQPNDERVVLNPHEGPLPQVIQPIQTSQSKLSL